MLNISKKSINKEVQITSFKSGKHVFNNAFYPRFNRFLLYFSGLVVIILFLPWTQNVTSKGYVTTLLPDQRPTFIQSPIPGKIEQWFVQEGDFVAKGDTILRISEVKSDYFDEKLLERTGDQITSKSASLKAYQNKVERLNNQIAALKQEQQLKLEQAQNKYEQAQFKLTTDSIDLAAAELNLSIANTQYQRAVNLQEQGLKAVKDVEEKRLKLQATQAKLVSQENKLKAARNELINAKLELARLNASYAEKISKSESDLFSAESMQYNAEAEVSKLENSYSNYSFRNGLLYITAPQNGYINKVLKGGVGGTFKEGEYLIKIMPSQYNLAVETYVRPIDLPLIHIGEKVRVQFDGWPAIVFSGWETLSYGTYGAKVVAIETFISENGKYRVLLAPDAEDHQWPNSIRAGAGAKTIALLKEVPIWYELWRQINGFPPDYYLPEVESDTKKK